MYRQKAFDIGELDAIYNIIEQRSVAQVVTLNDGVLTASMVPLLLDRSRGALGTVVGHFARANAQWKTVDTTVDALVIFTGPDAYVSPSFYPSKSATGKVVPTWNYTVVQARGSLSVHDDPAFVAGVVRRLTARHEAGHANPWSVDDAPPDYIDAMLGAIVGFEIEITHLEGANKLSQNRPAADVEGVIAGLSSGTAADRAVADLMRS